MIYKSDDKIITGGFLDIFDMSWKFCKILFLELGCYLHAASKSPYWFPLIRFCECAVVLPAKMSTI